jgi:PhzF family phenazine biosynthesis protein
MRHRFHQLDVFTATPLLGNPLAVVHAAHTLDDARMAAFARWTNLSETTFLLPPTQPQADYRVRIFTPGGELPFAGHPTLGSCRAWLAGGGQPRTPGVAVQECGVGLVPVRVDPGGQRLAFAAPASRREAVEPALLARVMAALGLPASTVRRSSWLDNGPRWLALELPDAQAVLALRPDHGALKTLAKVGVVGAHAPGGPAQFEVRAFAAPLGVEEDPVTGSLNASLAQWLMEDGRAPQAYVASQGTAMGRAGRVHIRRDADGTWVGGDVVICVDGSVEL